MKKFLIRYLVFLFLSINITFGQCVDSLVLNTGNIEKKGTVLIYPIKFDTIYYSEHGGPKIGCSIQDGQWNILFKETNEVFVSFYIVKGKLEKKIKYYFPSGQLSSIIKCKKNIRNGKCHHYYRNGNPNLISHWRNGKMEGRWKYFNENGKLYKVDYYNEGHLYKSTIKYDNIPEDIRHLFKS